MDAVLQFIAVIAACLAPLLAGMYVQHRREQRARVPSAIPGPPAAPAEVDAVRLELAKKNVQDPPAPNRQRLESLFQEAESIREKMGSRFSDPPGST
jgi:hypothetical protein